MAINNAPIPVAMTAPRSVLNPAAAFFIPPVNPLKALTAPPVLLSIAPRPLSMVLLLSLAASLVFLAAVVVLLNALTAPEASPSILIV